VSESEPSSEPVIRRFGGDPIKTHPGSSFDNALLDRFPEGLIRELARSAYSMVPYAPGVWEYKRTIDDKPAFVTQPSRERVGDPVGQG